MNSGPARLAIYDGQNFFYADHEGGRNYLGTSKDLTIANVEAARGDQG